MDAGGKETEPPPPIPLFSTRDHLEDPRLVAYVPHDRQSISSTEYDGSSIFNCSYYRAG